MNTHVGLDEKTPHKIRAAHLVKVMFWASRPKTLLASISPVLIGASIAYTETREQQTKINWNYFTYTLFQIIICAVLIQILCNYVNDLWDYYKGADTLERKGPLRVVSSGLIAPSLMKKIIIALTILIVALGAVLSYKGGLVILAIGILSIIGAYVYTAGPCPLAYHALGELFVLIFFGPVPVFGTHYLLTHEISLAAILSGMTTGFIATALLIVNNIRDVEEDQTNNKTTLAVVIGKKYSQLLFHLCLFLPFAVVYMLSQTYFSNKLLLVAPLSLLATKISLKLKTAKTGPDFNTILGQVGLFLFLFSLTLSTLISL